MNGMISAFSLGDNPALGLSRLLRRCKEEGIRKVTITNGEYHLDPLFCVQRNLNISNHGFNGPKRIGLLIEDMEDFEIDFSGSTLICDGIMTAIGVLNSKNITIRNVKLKNPTPRKLECRVVAHGEDYVDVECIHGMEQMLLRRGDLYGKYDPNMWTLVGGNIEFDPSGAIAEGTGDCTFGTYCFNLNFEPLDDDHIRIFGGTRKPPVGNVLVFNGIRRFGAGIVLQDASDVLMEDLTLHSCHGMGLLAQVSHNITLRRFNVLRTDGQLCTVSADATHFVHCTGLVLVEDCTFEGQLDDALNIHGIYTRIIDKDQRGLTVQFMHGETQGVPIYRPGDQIQILQPDVLLPYTQRTLESVEIINDSLVVLVLEEGTEGIQVGDDVENITRNADLIFRRNTVRDNRARGMLIGTPGKVLIEDCTFHTAGTPILFESDGKYWFESGGTKDITIQNNCFDHCRYGIWGNAVINILAREREEEGRYFHGTIRVLNNRFLGGHSLLAQLNNVEQVIIQGNEMSQVPSPQIQLSHIGSADIQADLR